LQGEWLEKSLDLRNWESARELLREWESEEGHSAVPMKEACERFVTDSCSIIGEQ